MTISEGSEESAKLRILHVTVQPVLVWDDGETLSPGPDAQSMNLPTGQVKEFIDGLHSQVKELEYKMLNERASE